eukprot:7479966-Pyramimonas_sp.AAC.1
MPPPSAKNAAAITRLISTRAPRIYWRHLKSHWGSYDASFELRDFARSQKILVCSLDVMLSLPCAQEEYMRLILRIGTRMHHARSRTRPGVY